MRDETERLRSLLSEPRAVRWRRRRALRRLGVRSAGDDRVALRVLLTVAADPGHPDSGTARAVLAPVLGTPATTAVLGALWRETRSEGVETLLRDGGGRPATVEPPDVPLLLLLDDPRAARPSGLLAEAVVDALADADARVRERAHAALASATDDGVVRAVATRWAADRRTLGPDSGRERGGPAWNCRRSRSSSGPTAPRASRCTGCPGRPAWS